MCLGENLERKRERICLEKCSKMPKIIFLGGFGGYIDVLVTLQLRPLVRSSSPLVVAKFDVDICNLGFFPGLTLDAYLKVFSNSD